MKVLIVDDHALFREGLKFLLARLGHGMQILEAGSAEAGLAHAAAGADVGLILLDCNLPGRSGLDSLRLFRAGFPAAAIVLLSGLDAPAVVGEAMAGGARGFIHKSVTADAMHAAIGSVLAGGTCHAAADPPAAPAADPPPQLTPRQRQVLARLCEGKANKEIARELEMSENTVRIHVAGILRVFGVRSRTEAAMLAYRSGLVG